MQLFSPTICWDLSDRHRRVGRIPWRRAWQPTPVFLPGDPLDRGAWRAPVMGSLREATQPKRTQVTIIPLHIFKKFTLGIYKEEILHVYTQIFFKPAFRLTMMKRFMYPDTTEVKGKHRWTQFACLFKITEKRYCIQLCFCKINLCQ